jgi:hypothetical protein
VLLANFLGKNLGVPTSANVVVVNSFFCDFIMLSGIEKKDMHFPSWRPSAGYPQHPFLYSQQVLVPEWVTFVHAISRLSCIHHGVRRPLNRLAGYVR